jgi:hypothetical protein
MTRSWRRAIAVLVCSAAAALVLSGCPEQKSRPSPRRPSSYQKKKKKKPPVVKKSPVTHPEHEHPHTHPHAESDHHHHAHPHPHLTGPNGHHHPF